VKTVTKHKCKMCKKAIWPRHSAKKHNVEEEQSSFSLTEKKG